MLSRPTRSMTSACISRRWASSRAAKSSALARVPRWVRRPFGLFIHSVMHHLFIVRPIGPARLQSFRLWLRLTCQIMSSKYVGLQPGPVRTNFCETQENVSVPVSAGEHDRHHWPWLTSLLLEQTGRIRQGGSAWFPKVMSQRLPLRNR
jgi:hypothetical protein